MPNYRLNNAAGDWDDNRIYRHFKFAKESGAKVSEKIIFKKNETKKSVYPQGVE